MCRVNLIRISIGLWTQVLRNAKLSIGDMDLYEVNEAFGPVPLGWKVALGADEARLNVNGGAQANGTSRFSGARPR